MPGRTAPTHGHRWKSVKISAQVERPNQWKSMKINGNRWKPVKIHARADRPKKWKSMKINRNQWKSMDINENRRKFDEKRWKSIKIDENRWAQADPHCRPWTQKRPRGMTDYDGQAVGVGVWGPLPTSGCHRLPHRNISQGIHMLFQGNRIILKDFVIL